MTKIKSAYLVYLPVVLGVLLYSHTFQHGFVLDDELVLTKNEHVLEGLSGIWDLCTTNYAHGHQGFNDGLYRPASLISFAIEQSLFSLNPSISHFIQVILYGILLLGLMLWMRALFPDKQLFSVLVVCLFAVHPLHTEVVGNLKSRDELLAMLFFVYSCWQFVKWTDGHSLKHLIASVSLFFLALFSKESAVSFVVVYPLMLWMKGPADVKTLVKKSSIFLLPTVLFLLVRQMVLADMGPVDSGVSSLLQNALLFSDGLLQRLSTGSAIQGLYISKLFIPVNLAHDYSFNQIPVTDFSDGMSVVWAIVCLALIGVGVLGLVRRKWWGFGILFYFVTISVASNVFVLIGAMAAERFVFAPSLGWCLALVSGMYAFDQVKTYRTYLVVGVSAVFAFLTVLRAQDWKTNYTLFSADIHKIDQSARAHYNYGTALIDEARANPSKANTLLSEAEKELQKAIQIWPDYQDAYNNLGIVLINAKKLDKAKDHLTNFVSKFPEYYKGLYNLAYVCFQLKDYALAETYFEQYYAQVQTTDVLFMIAESEGYQQKFDEAIEHLIILTEKEPQKARGHIKLGTAYALLQNVEAAEAEFAKAVKLAPNNTDAHFNLGLVYFNSSRYALARQEFSEALIHNPNMEQAKGLLQQLKSMGQ